MFGSFWYSIKQAALQVVRNRAMSIASLFSITAMMLILGLFFVLIVNIGVAMETAKMDYDTVSVYPATFTPASARRIFILSSEFTASEGSILLRSYPSSAIFLAS